MNAISSELNTKNSELPMPDPWPGLVNQALPGTGRKAFFLPTSSGTPLGETLSRVATGEPARALLGAAATLSLYRRAGWLPPVSSQLLTEPCELDAYPRCSQRAGLHLATMLGGEYEEALDEWITEAATDARQLVPDESIPALLDSGLKNAVDPHLHQILSFLVGNRGLWLASLRPQWGYITAWNLANWDKIDPERDWQAWSGSARLSLLLRLRAHEPGRALPLVESTWAQDDADYRHAILQILYFGLTMGDEPFLEAALDDRSAKVRQVAAYLLSMLPDSRLVGRMVDRLSPLLSFINLKQRNFILASPVSKGKISVLLPGECDKGMQRDGIERKWGYYAMGNKSAWLLQMLMAVPPSIWCRLWSVTPAELVDASNRSEEGSLMKQGWVEATQRNRDADWAEALLALWPSKDPSLQLNNLLFALPPERREAFILPLVESGRYDMLELLPFLEKCSKPLSERLGRAVLAAWRHYMTQSKHEHDRHARSILEIYAYGLPESILDEATAGWPTGSENWPFWEEAVDKFMSIIQFRREMLKELRP
jgi:hypothetical protein